METSDGRGTCKSTASAKRMQPWWAPAKVAPKAIAAAVALAIVFFASGWVDQNDNPSYWTGDVSSPEGLERAVNETFPNASCVTAATAEHEIRRRAPDLALSDWEITLGPGVRNQDCVRGSVNVGSHRIILLLAQRPEVGAALSRVANTLLERCFDQGDATFLVASVLNTLGESGWEIQNDGPVGGPLGRLDEVERHVEAGCYVYAGTGWTSEGLRLYFVSGR